MSLPVLLEEIPDAVAIDFVLGLDGSNETLSSGRLDMKCSESILCLLLDVDHNSLGCGREHAGSLRQRLAQGPTSSAVVARGQQSSISTEDAWLKGNINLSKR